MLPVSRSPAPVLPTRPSRIRRVPAIAVKGLERRFDEVYAVRGVDIEVAAGEIYGFLGPDGAGKTTTVRMLTTLLLPTGGSASVAGHDVVDEAAEVRRTIGVALQEAALDPLMTGRELIRLQATLHGMSRAAGEGRAADRKSTRLNSSHLVTSYAVCCSKKKKKTTHATTETTLHTPG